VRLLSVVVILCSAVAVAQEGSDLDTDAARALFKRGTVQYDAGDYRGALGMFEQAKAIKPLPAFDYNIARCREQLGELDAAVAAYDRYLATQPPDAADVRAHVGELRARVAASSPGTARPPAPAPSAPLPQSPHRGRALTIAGVVVGGAGLALVGAGIGLGVDGDKQANALTAADLAHRPFDSAVEHRMQNDRAGAIALCTIGAAASATGVVLIVLGRRAHARAYAWSAR
jgi:tetratricopeptide (TPR) repeat protein